MTVGENKTTRTYADWKKQMVICDGQSALALDFKY